MSGFFTALIKQRRDAKKADPDVRGRFNEILAILQKYDYDDGITPEIVVGIIQDLGPTAVKIGQIASQQSEYIPPDYADALAKLRSSVAPMDMETVRAQIEKHLGKPVEEHKTTDEIIDDLMPMMYIKKEVVVGWMRSHGYGMTTIGDGSVKWAVWRFVDGKY